MITLNTTRISSLPAPSSYIDHIEITKEEVYQVLTDLHPAKAKGCDNLHPMVLKLCADALTHLFQKAFSYHFT